MCGQQREDKINNNLRLTSKFSPHRSESLRFSITSDLTDDNLSDSDALDGDLTEDDLECFMPPIVNKRNSLAREMFRQKGDEKWKNQQIRDINCYQKEMKISNELKLLDIALLSRAKINEKKLKILKKY